MSYSEFKKMDDVESAFSLTVEDTHNLFETVPEVKPSEFLEKALKKYTSLALAIHTEKAKSEFIIAPILAEICEILKEQIVLFSGVDLNADPEKGLTGTCDFIISRSRQKRGLKAPVVTIVEAKNDNIEEGLPQCISMMVGAQLFNKQKKNEINIIYGCVTTGSNWQFLKLEEQTAFIDVELYYLKELGKILGILVNMVKK